MSILFDNCIQQLKEPSIKSLVEEMLQNNVAKLLYEIQILIIPEFKLHFGPQSKPFENYLKQTLVKKSISKLSQSWVHDLASQKPDDFHE